MPTLSMLSLNQALISNMMCRRLVNTKQSKSVLASLYKIKVPLTKKFQLCHQLVNIKCV